MRSAFALVLVAMLTAGCEAILLPLALIAWPLATAGEAMTVREGITVIDATGRYLSGPPPETAVERRVVQLNGDETVCTGTLQTPSERHGKIVLTCSDRSKREAFLQPDLTLNTLLTIRDLKTDEGRSVNRQPVEDTCTGRFFEKRGAATTFLVRCKGLEEAAIAGPRWSAAVSLGSAESGSVALKA